jgi:alpha-1,6-mannosyltransferase
VKLCDLTQFYSPFSGGVKRYLHEKIRHLQRATPHEHVLIVPGERNGCTSSERSRVYTIRSPLVSRTSRYRILLNLRALDEIIERERPMLIESSDPYQIGWRAIRLGRRRHIPVAGYYHSHFAEAHLRFARTAARNYVRRLYNSFAATLVPSRGLAGVLESWGVRNVRVASLGVNTETFFPSRDDGLAMRDELGIPSARRLLLYVGRLSPEKNSRLLFRAFEALNARTPDRFHLVVIGDGPERRNLSALQRRCANVTWLRYCAEPEQLARFYRAADLLVHPGTQETFGLVALESQACGTPVVGIRDTYMDEIILHEQSWWARNDSAEELARAIERACDLDLRAVGQRAAAAARENFSWSAAFKRLFYIYEEICSRYGEENGRNRNASLRHSAVSPP